MSRTDIQNLINVTKDKITMRVSAVLFLLVPAVYIQAELLENDAEPVIQVTGRRFKIRPLKHSRKYYERMLGLRPQKDQMPLRGTSYNSIARVLANVNPPTFFSWADKPGTVTSVKNQGGCGSCYAFAATAAIESKLVIWNRRTALNLSEQQIIDCCGEFGTYGCDGGYMENVYRCLEIHRGQTLETLYPYKAVVGACRNVIDDLYATDITYIELPNDNQSIYLKILYTVGPISIGIHSNEMSFFQYAGGIYDDPECALDSKSIDHAVLLVGYGQENGVPYWLIKNSWGTWWGEGGYMRLIRGQRMCRIGFMASIPISNWLHKRLAAGEDVRHDYR